MNGVEDRGQGRQYSKLVFAANGAKFQSHAVTLTLVQQCPISNLSELCSYTAMYSNFMFLNQCHFELSCKNTHINTHTNTHRRTQRLMSTL